MMKVFDAHCDTLQKIYENAKTIQFKENEIKGKYIQVFAAFVSESKEPWQYVKRLMDIYDAVAEAHSYCQRNANVSNLISNLTAKIKPVQNARKDI